jgi:hypothetical protein
MDYTIRRISLRSALRVGAALGWIVALIPALPLALLLSLAVDALAGLFAPVQPYDLNFLGQTVATLDLLGAVGLRPLAEWLAGLADLGAALFWLLLGLITVGGAVLVMAGSVLACLLYNMLASVAGGLRVQLERHA